MKFVASVMCSLESSLVCRADAACRRYYISLHKKKTKKTTLPGIYSKVCVWAAAAGRDCGEVINIVYIDVAVVVIGDCGRSWCRCESSSVPKNHDGLRALWIKVSSLRVLQNMQMFALCSLSAILLWHFAAIFVVTDSANPAAGGCIRCDFVAYLRAAEPACWRRLAGIKLGAWVKLLTSETFPLCRHWLCIQTKTDVEIPSSVLESWHAKVSWILLCILLFCVMASDQRLSAPARNTCRCFFPQYCGDILFLRQRQKWKGYFWAPERDVRFAHRVLLFLRLNFIFVDDFCLQSCGLLGENPATQYWRV